MPTSPIRDVLQPFVDRHQLAGRMILRGGELDGRRIVSRDGVRAMTATQTRRTETDPPGHGYGYQFATTQYAAQNGPSPAGWCDHGGTYGNQMWIDPEHGLTIVVMLHHAGWPTIEGEKPLQAAQRVASKIHGKQQIHTLFRISIDHRSRREACPPTQLEN